MQAHGSIYSGVEVPLLSDLEVILDIITEEADACLVVFDNHIYSYIILCAEVSKRGRLRVNLMPYLTQNVR